MNKNNDFQSTPLLDESDYAELRALGLTDEEFEVLQNAETIKASVDMLPDDDKGMEKLAAKIKDIFAGKNTGKEIMQFFSLAEKDVDLFTQIAMFFKVVDMYREEPAAVTEKISLADISAEKEKQEEEEFVEIFTQLVKEVSQLSPEDKAALKAALKNNN